MKYLKLLGISLIVAFLLVGVTNRFTTLNYPPCNLVVKGIGVSTFGCMNVPSSQSYACKNESSNSAAMKHCIDMNHYNYKTFPFGYKQLFGSNSNLVDSKPKTHNEIATFISTFLLSLVVLSLYNILSKKHIAS